MTATPIEISNSEIQTYKECRRKWYLSYHRRLSKIEKSFSGPLALGSRVHKALEDYYKGQAEGGDRSLLAYWHDLVVIDRAAIEAEGRDETDFNNEVELGRLMLEGYLEWNDTEGIDSDLELISAEELLTLPMLDGRVLLKGKLDQRVRRRSDGTRLVRDFKTTANFADLTKTGHLSEQFLTYQTLEAALKTEGERCDGTLITMLKKVKRTASARPPFYMEMEVRHNVFALRNFWTRLNGVLRDMVATRDALDAGVDHHLVAYPTPGRDCSWKCPFYAQCQMFDDGSAVEQSLADNFEEHDPYGYYSDEYQPGK